MPEQGSGSGSGVSRSGVAGTKSWGGGVNAKTFSDFGIQLPAGASGEVDVTCPECSPTRKKKHARCLSVNVEKGTWICHHCGWAGGLAEGERRVAVAWRKPQYRRPEPLPMKLDAEVERLDARRIPTAVRERSRATAVKGYSPPADEHG